MMHYIALGYSIHDVLDAIQAILQAAPPKLDVPSDPEPVNCQSIVRLRLAGEHLARIMCELTTSGRSGFGPAERDACKPQVWDTAVRTKAPW